MSKIFKGRSDEKLVAYRRRRRPWNSLKSNMAPQRGHFYLDRKFTQIPRTRSPHPRCPAKLIYLVNHGFMDVYGTYIDPVAIINWHMLNYGHPLCLGVILTWSKLQGRRPESIDFFGSAEDNTTKDFSHSKFLESRHLHWGDIRPHHPLHLMDSGLIQVAHKHPSPDITDLWCQMPLTILHQSTNGVQSHLNLADLIPHAPQLLHHCWCPCWSTPLWTTIWTRSRGTSDAMKSAKGISGSNSCVSVLVPSESSPNMKIGPLLGEFGLSKKSAAGPAPGNGPAPSALKWTPSLRMLQQHPGLLSGG